MSCTRRHVSALQLHDGDVGMRWEGQLGLQMCDELERMDFKRLLFPAPCSTCNFPSSFSM